MRSSGPAARAPARPSRAPCSAAATCPAAPPTAGAPPATAPPRRAAGWVQGERVQPVRPVCRACTPQQRCAACTACPSNQAAPPAPWPAIPANRSAGTCPQRLTQTPRRCTLGTWTWPWWGAWAGGLPATSKVSVAGAAAATTCCFLAPLLWPSKRTPPASSLPSSRLSTHQHLAAAQGDLDTCRALLAAGADGVATRCPGRVLRDFEASLEQLGRSGRWAGAGAGGREPGCARSKVQPSRRPLGAPARRCRAPAAPLTSRPALPCPALPSKQVPGPAGGPGGL